MNTEDIFKSALTTTYGITIGGETINHIRYADDATIIAKNSENLPNMFNKIYEENAHNQHLKNKNNGFQ